MNNINNTKGFTLIEIIVTLVLVGILTAVAGLWISQAAGAFILAQQNVETMQKGQIAITRLIKEVNVIGTVSSGTPTGITFMSYGSNVDTGGGAGSLTTRSICYSAGTVSINDSGDCTGAATLVDNVLNFSLKYYAAYNGVGVGQGGWISGSTRLVDITLTLNGAGGTPMDFTARVYPRNQ